MARIHPLKILLILSGLIFLSYFLFTPELIPQALTGAVGGGGISGGGGGGGYIGIYTASLNTGLGAGLTGYNFIDGQGVGWAGSDASRLMNVPVSGTLQNFVVSMLGTQPGDAGQVCNVRVGSTTGTLANTALTISVPLSGSGVYSDTTHTAAVTAGQYIDVGCVNSSGSTGAIMAVSVGLHQ